VDFQDVRTYFLRYVEQYEPYRDSKVYRLFTNFLIETYFKDSYETIPADFKTAYETQVLPTSFVIPFLKSVGVTDDVISKLNDSDRLKLATLMGDFHRYKGTIGLVSKLLTNFASNDAVSVYELWLDYVNGSWRVLPKIVGQSALSSDPIKKSMPFSFLYDATHWYIDESTLTTMNDSGELELPYKTNCLYVDGTVQEDISLIVSLVSSLVLESFKGEQLQLIFNSTTTYLTNFENFYTLWFYIIRKLTNSGTNASPFTTHSQFDPLLVFNTYEIPTKLNSTTPRGKINIQTIIDEYYGYKNNTATETINTDIWSFFKDKIDIFSGPVISSTQTFDQYRISVRSKIGGQLVDYVDGRLDGSSSMNTEVQLIFGELYNSILVFKYLTTSALDTSYIDYMLLTLSGFSKDISTSSFYTLLNFMKPYHCDMFSKAVHNITSNSLFDNGLVSYMHSFSFFLERVTHESISDQFMTNEFHPAIYTNEVVASVVTSSSSNSSASTDVTTNSISGPYTYTNPNGGGVGIPTTIIYPN